VVTTQMAKPKSAGKSSAGAGDDGLSSFKVRRKAGQVVAKITTLRGLRSIADLFEQKDVEDFFNHLLLHELQREQTSLTGRPPK
jgi:hypothetical protein